MYGKGQSLGFREHYGKTFCVCCILGREKGAGAGKAKNWGGKKKKRGRRTT